MAHAAIFELDRTLLPGSAANVIVQALTDVGLSVPPLPGLGVRSWLFERYGDDPISVRMSRVVAASFRGVDCAVVAGAAELIADVLLARVLPGAMEEVASQRAQGAHLVLATTTPNDLIGPLAQRMGFDEVVATRFTSADRAYTGAVDGYPMWGKAKATAVAELAGSLGIDLTSSTAYTDSWYDLPLLEMVGHPVIVKPDVRLAVTARLRRWPTQSFDG